MAESEVLAKRDSAQSPCWSVSDSFDIAVVVQGALPCCSNSSYAVVDVSLLVVFEDVGDAQLATCSREGAIRAICLLHELLNSTSLATEAIVS